MADVDVPLDGQGKREPDRRSVEYLHLIYLNILRGVEMCVSNLSSPYLGHVLQHRLVSVSRLLVIDGVVVAEGVDVKVPGES